MIRSSVLLFAATACMTGSSSRTWTPNVVVPVSLEATYIARTECTGGKRIYLDYGTSGTTWTRNDNGTVYFAQSSQRNLKAIDCPEAVVQKLVGLK